MRQLFDRCTLWIVDAPWLTTVLVLLITIGCGFGYYNPDKVRKWLKAAPKEEVAETRNEESDDRPPPNVSPLNLTRSDAILVIESDQFFTPAGATALRKIVEDLESLRHVRYVLWVDRVPMINIFGLPEPIFPKSTASPQRFAAAQEKALENPLVRGQLLSKDAKSMLLMVHFDWAYVRQDTDVSISLRETAENAIKDIDVAMAFTVTGRVPLFLTAMKSQEENQWRYQLIGYGMILFMAMILFRGIVAVIVVALAPCLGVFWTLGFIRYLDFQDNPFNDVVLPVLLSLVGLTDGVHLMVQIRRLRASGLTGRGAARLGIKEVGLACALTSLTTAIGFGSLSLAHHEIVKEFGWCCVIGVVFTLIAVLTVIPLACSTWLGRWIHIGHDKSLIDKNLSKIGFIVDWVLKYPKTISIMGIVLTVAFLVISLQLRPDERNANALPATSEAGQGMKHMDQAFGGLEYSNVEIHWGRSIDSGSAEVLEVIAKVDDLLNTEPLIGQPLSLRNLVDSLPGEGPIGDRASMVELLPPPLKRAFFTPESRTALVSFRVQDLGIARYAPVFNRVESGLSEIRTAHPEFDFELTGSAAWRWKNLYRIVMDLAASLGSASIIIFGVLAIAYRSVRLGLISIVPNMFPLAITGTGLYLFGQSLEIVSVCAFTVCLGIAVDDTIHFLTRFQEERHRNENQDHAIRLAFTGVGTALIMTTIILVAGFTTVMFSDSRDHQIFASMGAMTIASALFGDLVFLPAMLSWLMPKVKTDLNE